MIFSPLLSFVEAIIRNPDPVALPNRNGIHMATRPGSSSHHTVDLVQAYSNPCDQVERPRSLLDLPRAVGRGAPHRGVKQVQKRLDSGEVAELVAAYEAGEEVKKLAGRFGIHWATVREILKREGIVRRTAIRSEDLPWVIRLYETGWSLARVGAEFDISAHTVGDALRKAGVPIRHVAGPSRAGDYQLAVRLHSDGVRLIDPAGVGGDATARAEAGIERAVGVEPGQAHSPVAERSPGVGLTGDDQLAARTLSGKMPPSLASIAVGL